LGQLCLALPDRLRQSSPWAQDAKPLGHRQLRQVCPLGLLRETGSGFSEEVVDLRPLVQSVRLVLLAGLVCEVGAPDVIQGVELLPVV